MHGHAERAKDTQALVVVHSNKQATTFNSVPFHVAVYGSVFSVDPRPSAASTPLTESNRQILEKPWSSTVEQEEKKTERVRDR